MKKKMSINRKGQALLPEETVKIIIAVICIIALIALLAAVYFMTTGNQNMKYAEAVVNGENGIANEIKRVNAGGVDNPIFLVPNPAGWGIFSFVGGGKKPNNCAGTNCLCICEKISIGIFNVDERQAQRCDKKGICTPVVNLKKFNAIDIKGGGVLISIKKINGLIEVTKNEP